MSKLTLSIWRLSLKGKRIEKYDSITEASQWVVKHNLSITLKCRSLISKVIYGKLDSIYGFKWEFDESVTEDLEGENWKEISGHPNHYISNLGRYKNKKGHIKKFQQPNNPNEFLSFIIEGKYYFVHRLVLSTFKPYKGDYSKYKVRHKDGNKMNNILENLEWVISYKELNKNKKREYEIRELQEDEEYRTISKYPNYEVSNFGYVRNKTTKQNIKIQTNIKGYCSVGLYKNKHNNHEFVHQLVAKEFLPNEENKPTVNHKNKIKNDNRKDNLEWATNSEQQIHKNQGKEKGTNSNTLTVWRLDSKTGNEIEKYESIEEATLWLYNKGIIRRPKSNIYAVVKGEQQTCGGFKWKLDESVTKDLEGELWKEIPKIIVNKNNCYVSNLGRCKDNGYIRKFKDGNNYISLTINNIFFVLHRLILMTFCPNENAENLFVNHKDGNRRNNNLDNLEWSTPSENTQHAYDTCLNEKNCRKVIQFDLNMNEMNRYNSINEAARKISINTKTIKACCEGITKNPRKFYFKYA